MEMKINRKDINVLLKSEYNGKYFAIGTVENVLTEIISGTYHYFIQKHTLKTLYVVLWGNTDNVNEMGLTPILTPSGKASTRNSAFNTYFKMIKTSTQLEFSK